MTELKFKIELLNKIIVVENVMCIYRNFWTISKRAKILVAIQIAVALVVNVARLLLACNFIIHTPYYDNTMILAQDFVYKILTTALTLLNIIAGIGQSGTFQKIIPDINYVHQFCAEGRFYQRELRKLTFRSFIYSIIIITTCIVILAAYTITSNTPSLDDTHSYIVVAGLTVFKLWREIQWYVELFTFNALITITALALKQMTETLIERIKTFEENNENDYADSGIVNLSLLHEVVVKSVQAYACLRESSIKMRQCFGLQMMFSLFSFSVIYIFLSYQGITSIMTLKIEFEALPRHIVLVLQLINFMGAIVSVLRSGQMSHNAMEELRGSTAKLHHKLLRFSDPGAVKLRKLVKDFLRQMALEPVRVSVMTQLPVQMALLLEILTVIVSYTIIFLQFNHVV